MASSSGKSVLFVCLGNICRSTMAEGILKHLVMDRADSQDWNIDSCGTAGYHIGSQPDRRTVETLQRHDIKDYKHKARQLRKSDFAAFKWIFVMDNSNLHDVNEVMPSKSTSNVLLLRMFDPDKDCDTPIVIDAYYHDDSYFELCYQQCLKSLKTFLDEEFP